MEPAGPGGGTPPPVPVKKKLNRAPSPARPKDLTGWSLSKARRPSPVSLSILPPGPRRSLLSPGSKKQVVPATRMGVKSKVQASPGTRRGTDSSSEGSCASEENSSSSRGSSEEGGVSGASSRIQLSTSLAFSDLTEDMLDGGTEGLMREMEELRSENDYLKDEIEELRSEMLEMRDVYMEEDVYQLHELRQQLEQVHKTCRILQYRLKKAERRGLRVSQTGHVDSEFISTLEQDVKVAKDVSVRLHNELEAVEKKRIKVEEENEELRQRLIETDLAKQVLQNEMDKSKENSLKKRRSGKMEKKPSPQEDSADIKCQLHFAKEESALMCKKLSKLVKENDSMKEELMKYRSLYGDLDSSLSVEELANSPYSREAELKSHLKLVEEEANILSRRIVELEVENRGLRAEMDEMKVHADREHLGQDSRFAFPPGESRDNFVELRRHLQFVEEEADLLRRSMIELEDQNKLLMNELNKYKSDHDLDITLSEDSCSVISEPSQEELVTAKMQINELNGKVKKLQYENRVLLSNLQRYDLASCQTTKPLMETDAEAGDSAQCVPTPLWREGPVGGETDSTDSKERAVKATLKSPDACNNSPSRLPKIKELESLFGIRAQVELISKAIEVLTTDANGFLSGIKLCTDNDCGDLLLTEAIDNSEVTSDSKLIRAIFTRLVVLQQELNCFTKKVDSFGEFYKGQVDSLSIQQDSTCPVTSKDPSRKEHCATIQTECRSCREKEVSCWEKTEIDHNIDQTKGYKTYQPEDNESYVAEIKDLQLVLSEANETMQGLQEQLSQERQLRKEDEETFNQKIAQLKEDQQKLLLRREFELQSLGLQRRLEQKFWSQEKMVLVQEMQQFRQSFFLTFMKLKWFLQRWRNGKVLQSEGEDFLEVNSMKELYMLIEEEELNLPATDYKSCDGEIWPQNMTIECMKTLSDAKRILKDLCSELQEERRGMNELQQQFAKAKAAWEMERTEPKLESGKHGIEKASPDIKAALKWEREEHQHLLAESYSAVMDLTKQLQVSEKNWAQEKEEMLARFQQERKETQEQIKELENKLQQKEEESWVRQDPERRSSCWKEELNDKMQDKDIDCDMDANGTDLKRTKSVSSMSEFESMLDCSPFIPGKTHPDFGNNKGIKGFLASQLLVNSSIDSDLSQKSCKYMNDKSLSEHLAKDNLVISSWDYTMGKARNSGEPSHKQIQRSYTAPDRTGIRIYYSPPVVRRLDVPLVHSKEEKLMGEPGFLFTMAKPKETEVSERLSGNYYSRWFCNFSQKQSELLDKDTLKDSQASVRGFPSSLGDFEISGNMSDDMKEITNCVRQAIRSSSLERKTKSTSSQTVGLSTVGVQTVQMLSVGLQTDLPRTSLHAKSWSPRGSSLLSTRSKHISTSLDKVHSRIERPCCSPKYGSPKLQRRSLSKLDGSKDRSLWNLHQSKQNGSAWARSTTTRDSPVLTNIYDGTSSLFNVVDHAGSTESLFKTGLPESRSKAEAPKYGIVQEFFRNVCGRATQNSSANVEKKEVEENNKRPDNHDHCSSAVCHPSYNVSKLLSKKTPRQHVSDEQKPSPASQVAKDGSPKDPDIISTTATEDLACNCSSHPVTSCFSRPSRTLSRQPHTRCQLHQEPAVSEDKVVTGYN
ncbi:microtubule cross-linking factor 2 isoform X2 [Pseudophryne corroboree]|uniref:microtubule cross-linking factor 2 isoform X2 n=1 Tax=Pseudophryne corroboree TaxID=495146 RepID=UPI0030816812